MLFLKSFRGLFNPKELDARRRNIYTELKRKLVTYNTVVAQTPDNLALYKLISHGSSYYRNQNASLGVMDCCDFRCYLFKIHSDKTEQPINSSYYRYDKAVSRLKHLPNRKFDSKNASLTAQCTNDQGKFWEFYNVLYANQGLIDSGRVNTESLKKLAPQMLDFSATEFSSCFDTKKYESLIDNDIALANPSGFIETLSFIITNSQGLIVEKKIQGPKPVPVFKPVISNIESKISNNS